MVQDVNRMATVENWEKEWTTYSKNLKLDKVYLETFRDGVYVDDKAMKNAIKFFKSKGVEVSGGITYNRTGGVRQRWESFCYSDPEQVAIIEKIAVLTAGYFDEIVLDDYYFTNCKCDLCIEGKGEKSWGEYRRDLLDHVAKHHIVEPAHKKNPKCKVIVKYPNWYDHFHGLGFDLERGPYTFDGVYTGTETRDPRGEQHLQTYESYGIIRYFENLRPGHNFGGWPLLQHSVYSKGNMFVWVIPDNFSHLYALPSVALNRLRTVLSRQMDVQIEGDSQISLFVYVNDTFVVHSFHNAPTQVNLVVKSENGVSDILSGEIRNRT